MKYLLLFIVCFAMSAAVVGQNKGAIENTVTDEENVLPAIQVMYVKPLIEADVCGQGIVVNCYAAPNQKRLNLVTSLHPFKLTSGILQGTITDAETGEPIIFGTVAIIKNGQVVTGTDTDLDGFYAITDLLPGLYDVEFSYTGYAPQKITDVYVGLLTIKLDAKMTAGQEFYFPPGCFRHLGLFAHDNLTQGLNFSASQIRRLPVIGN